MRQSVLIMWTLLLVSAASARGAFTLRTENFDVDPGWASIGSGTNSNNFGYRSTNFAGGSSAGEAGGTFTRTQTVRQYADTNLGGLIDLSMAFSASGVLDFTGRNSPDYGRPLIIGHFSTAGISTINVSNMIGIGLDDGGSLTDLYWTGVVILADGTNISFLPKSLLPTANVDHSWSYTWDPTGGSAGEGSFTFQLDSLTKVVELTAAQRAIGFSADAFGFGGAPAPSNPQSGWFADIYLDDVTYSAAVPEVSSASIWLLMGVMTASAAIYRSRQLTSTTSR